MIEDIVINNLPTLKSISTMNICFVALLQAKPNSERHFAALRNFLHLTDPTHYEKFRAEWQWVSCHYHIAEGILATFKRGFHRTQLIPNTYT